MQVPLLVAADLLPTGVDDIDEEEDPQVVSDNVKHIYAYLRQMEDKYAIPKVVYRVVTYKAEVQCAAMQSLGTTLYVALGF